MGNNYKRILPFENDTRIVDSMGFLPLSVLEPTKASKAKWKDAYFPPDENESRRSSNTEYLPDLKFSEFHAGLAENIVRYWSMKGARIVDPFAGRATRAVVSSKLERQYYGYEISPSTYERSLAHYKKVGISPTLYLESGIALAKTEDSFADLVFTCPPYWNIEKYESCEGQLSDCETYDDFMANIDICGQNIARILKPGAFCCWVCADFRSWSGDGQFYLFHKDTIDKFKEHGLVLHDIVIIKNHSPFAALQCGKCASKRYTSKIHEYLLVFKKPGEYVIPDYCTMDESSQNATNREFLDYVN